MLRCDRMKVSVWLGFHSIPNSLQGWNSNEGVQKRHAQQECESASDGQRPSGLNRNHLALIAKWTPFTHVMRPSRVYPSAFSRWNCFVDALMRCLTPVREN